MIVIKLDVTKIPKERIFIGKKGKYLDLRLVENKDGPDQYGNDGFVAIDLPKEKREAGEKGEIVGNWKEIGKPAPKPQPRTAPQRPAPKPADPELDPESEEIPF